MGSQSAMGEDAGYGRKGGQNGECMGGAIYGAVFQAILIGSAGNGFANLPAEKELLQCGIVTAVQILQVAQGGFGVCGIDDGS